MELHIRRSQNLKKKGLLSSASVEFILQAQLTLTNEETELLQTYESCLPAVHWVDYTPAVNVTDSEVTNTKYYSMKDFIKGLVFKDNQIIGIRKTESQIRERFEMMKGLLEEARDFNGEEVIKLDIT